MSTAGHQNASKQAAPGDVILKQGAADYDEDLRQALKLSVKEEHETHELQNADTKNLKEAMQLSILEAAGAEPEASTLNNDEKKQLEMAIMASLEDVSSQAPINDRLVDGAQGNTLGYTDDSPSKTNRPLRQIALSDKSPSNASTIFYEREERAICLQLGQIALSSVS